MKANLFLPALIGLLFVDLTLAMGQSNYESRNKNIGIAVDQNEFNHMVGETVVMMKGNSKIKIKDFIKMVRIDNTIVMNDLAEKNHRNKEFRALFVPKYSRLAVDKLHASLARGMCYYSKKHNIYWGGIPDSNSMFNIVKKQVVY